MTRTHRRRHVVAWLIIGPIALAVFVAAMIVRQPLRGSVAASVPPTQPEEPR